LIATATLSPDGVYRYLLTRTWPNHDAEDVDSLLRTILFVMLNPSTADALIDDPTVRRIVGFARIWKYNSVQVVNLFALRSSDPDALRRHPDPIGPANDNHIAEAAVRADLIVCGWGAQPDLRSRDRDVYGLLRSRARAPIRCLGLTTGGHPRHPLYLAKKTPLMDYGGPP
jgi:hypothetical protein